MACGISARRPPAARVCTVAQRDRRFTARVLDARPRHDAPALRRALGPPLAARQTPRSAPRISRCGVLRRPVVPRARAAGHQLRRTSTRPGEDRWGGWRRGTRLQVARDERAPQTAASVRAGVSVCLCRARTRCANDASASASRATGRARRPSLRDSPPCSSSRGAGLWNRSTRASTSPASCSSTLVVLALHELPPRSVSRSIVAGGEPSRIGGNADGVRPSRRAASVIGVGAVRLRRRRGVHGLGELEDLAGELEQLARSACPRPAPSATAGSASTSRLASARFWLIITNVERKIASSETIIVSSPYGYASTPNPIQQREPDDVNVDEQHRAGERRDAIGDAVLDALARVRGRARPAPDCRGEGRASFAYSYSSSTVVRVRSGSLRVGERMVEDVERVGRGGGDPDDRPACAVGHGHPEATGMPAPEQDDFEVVRPTIGELHDLRVRVHDRIVAPATGPGIGATADRLRKCARRRIGGRPRLSTPTRRRRACPRRRVEPTVICEGDPVYVVAAAECWSGLAPRFVSPPNRRRGSGRAPRAHRAPPRRRRLPRRALPRTAPCPPRSRCLATSRP